MSISASSSSPSPSERSDSDNDDDVDLFSAEQKQAAVMQILLASPPGEIMYMANGE
jgi:hypothetical protein